MLTGASGQDLVTAGFLVAQALNCQRPNGTNPCLECTSCKKIQAHVHPDIIHLQVPEDKKGISIDQIRQMETRLQVKPNEIDWRMVLISQAQEMNIQAQNTLLKTLEEPPQKTFFILTAPDGAGLLPTIVSRCRQIYFPPPKAADLANFLVSQYGVDQGEALTAVKIAGKDKEKAMHLLNFCSPQEPDQRGRTREKQKNLSQDWDWKTTKTWILDQMEGLLLAPEAEGEKALCFSEIISRWEEKLPLCLMIIGSFFRDLSIFTDSPQGVIHQDRFHFFQRAASTIPHKRMLEFLDLFLETEKRLNSNASVRLTLERFCLGLISCPSQPAAIL